MSFDVRYGGKKGKPHRLSYSDHYVAVRTHSRRDVTDVVHSSEGRAALDQVEDVFHLPTAGVQVFQVRAARKRAAVRDQVRGALKAEKEVRFAGRVLHDKKTQEPVLYTENLFVKFEDHRSETWCKKAIRAHGLKISRRLDYARNAYFLAAPEGCGTEVFAAGGKLLAAEGVVCAHPELVRRVRRLGAFPQQWHLKKTRIGRTQISQDANVEAAWAESQGAGIVIAIVDDGVDLAHEEFASPGKIVAPRNVTGGTGDPRPGFGNDHGTACAGVACADGAHGASGVAPQARLMPIRLASGLGSQAEADAFVWSAQHGADVISCSWGPWDGDPRDPSDPLHQAVTPLPDSTRLAIEFALEHGRGGKGCVICWAAGNGNESVDNDGYASFEKVIAVAACNDRGKRSAYSDFGDAIWCAFPSSDFPSHARTRGIWTTDRSGPEGYNRGTTSQGDAAGDYTNSFGGTSSACPGVAGVAALVLARNPELRWDEVQQILKESCEQIDKTGGNYGAGGHSQLYGYGRVDAAKAVTLAAPAAPDYQAVHTGVQDVAIKDLETSQIQVAVADAEPIRSLAVQVEIEHTYIGDLVVQVVPPAATGMAAITLHEHDGGALANLAKTYDKVNTPALAALEGQSPEGTWTLQVEDQVQNDQGTIKSFGVRIGL